MELTAILSDPIKNTPFKNRPLAFVLAVFLCSLFLLKYDIRLFTVFVTVCVAFCIKELFIKPKGKRFKSLTAYLVIFSVLASVLISLPQYFNLLKAEKAEGEGEIKAVITGVHHEKVYESVYTARMISVNGEALSCNAEITFFGNAGLFEYDTVTAYADIEYTLSGKTGSDRLSALGGGAVLSCEVVELKSVTDEQKDGFLYTVDGIRRQLGNRFSKLLSPKTSEFAKAMFIGERGGISLAFKKDVSALGISHILAVSGMHMSMLAALITFFIEKFTYSRRTKSAIVIVCSLLFMAIAGFSPSVVRACVMTVISLGAVFFYGKSDPITSLFLAGSVICFCEPSNILNCSFLLSFAATLGIVTCSLYAEQRAKRTMYSSRVSDMKLLFKVARAIMFSVMMTVCATLFTVPVLALYFDSLSLASVFTNFVAIPMATISIFLCVAVLAIGGVPFLGESICYLFDFIYELFEDFVVLCSNSFSFAVSLNYPFFGICLSAAFSVGVFIWLVRQRSPLALISVLTGASVLYFGMIQVYSVMFEDRTDVVYYASKTSEAFLINDGDESYVIDMGNGGKSVPLLGADDAFREYCDTKLDGFVITHYHSRHIGITKNLIKYVGVKTLYLPMPETENEQTFYDNIMLVCKEEGGVDTVLYERGEPLKLGRVTLEGTYYSLLERSAHPVLAFKISKGDNAVAYIGASVTESAVQIRAEELIAGCLDVIFGAHGPTPKNDSQLYYISDNARLYVNPFIKGNPENVLGEREYSKLSESSGIVRRAFRLS